MSLLGSPLETFLSIARLGTVQSASRELGVTQTGVTQRLKALESQLGTTLFTRSRRGMLLTSEGESLRRYCLTVRDLEGETLAKISGAGTRSEVRAVLQGPTSLMRSRVIPQCLPILKKFTELLVSFEISDRTNGADNLRSGSVHMAVVSPEAVTGEMDSKLLKPERYVLVGTRAWHRRPLREIIREERAIDFHPDDHATFSYLRKFDLLNLAKSGRHTVNSNEALLEMLQEGLGYGVLTQEFASTYMKSGALILLNSERALENPVALAWYPRPRMSPYFAALIRAIR